MFLSLYWILVRVLGATYMPHNHVMFNASWSCQVSHCLKLICLGPLTCQNHLVPFEFMKCCTIVSFKCFLVLWTSHLSEVDFALHHSHVRIIFLPCEFNKIVHNRVHSDASTDVWSSHFQKVILSCITGMPESSSCNMESMN